MPGGPIPPYLPGLAQRSPVGPGLGAGATRAPWAATVANHGEVQPSASIETLEHRPVPVVQ